MSTTARHLTRIRLELARSKAHPAGSARHGYEFVAPLDQDGRLDAAAWKAVRDRCRVRRFWGDEEDDIGHLVYRPGGAWAFHYDVHGDEDDEAGYRLHQHTFNLGDYVSIQDDEGEMHTFRVVRTDDVPV